MTMLDTVGPWNSKRWNPVLVLMVVGLSILTLGATSASFFGLDFGFLFLKFVDVECGELGGDLRVCCLRGVVVPGRPSWHFLLVAGALLLQSWLLFCSVTGL